MPPAKKTKEVKKPENNIIDPDKRSRRSSNPPPPSKPSQAEDDEGNEEDRCAQPLPTCSPAPPQPTWLHRLLRSDEEEEGSDEEAGSDEEHVEATPAPRSSAKKAKPKSTTPASRKARMAEEDLDEGVELAATSLIDCYERLVSEAPRAKSAPSMLLSMSLDKWSQLYTADPARAIVDVLNLFLRVCGLPESRLDLSDVDAARAPPRAPLHPHPCTPPPLPPHHHHHSRPRPRAPAHHPPNLAASRSIPHPPRWHHELALHYSQRGPRPPVVSK